MYEFIVKVFHFEQKLFEVLVEVIDSREAVGVCRGLQVATTALCPGVYSEVDIRVESSDLTEVVLPRLDSQPGQELSPKISEGECLKESGRM